MDTTPISTLVIIAILVIIALFVFASAWEARQTRKMLDQKIPVKMTLNNQYYSGELGSEKTLESARLVNARNKAKNAQGETE